MMDRLQGIIENYRRMPTGELVLLANSPGDLDPGVIPHLQAELIIRRQSEAASLLGNFLIEQDQSFYTPSLKDLSKDELKMMIKDRIDSGETIEGIKLDLKDNGIKMLDILNDEAELQNQSLGYLDNLKRQGLEESEINKEMTWAFGTSDEENDDLKQQLFKKGKIRLIAGYSIVIVVGIISLISVTVIGEVWYSSFALLAVGLWLVNEGYRLRR